MYRRVKNWALLSAYEARIISTMSTYPYPPLSQIEGYIHIYDPRATHVIPGNP